MAPMRVSNATKSAATCLGMLLFVTVLFYWKILLTQQFSLLTEWEQVKLGYSWYQFVVSSIKQGHLPLWDPFAFSGRSFAGEMQTGAFYPLNLLLALIPFNRDGVLSPVLYNWSFAVAHFLGACFMFALVRELGLARFSATVAAICFAFGGYVGGVPWPHYLWSSIWLPLILVFVFRAIRVFPSRPAFVYASLAGLCLGTSILAGGLHIAIMQTLIVITALGFACIEPQGTPPPRKKAAAYSVAILAVIGFVAFAAGAVQLLPSIEYNRLAVRWIGAPVLPATQKIPYAYLRRGVASQGFLTFLIFFAFNGDVGPGEVPIPYLGVFPLLLSVIGVWKAWTNPWVRYLAGLAVAAFLFSLGSFSLLHGLLYAVVPFLWMAREPGRFLYLADFALAILAAYGAERVYSAAPGSSWTALNRFLKWIAVAGAAALCIPAIYPQLEIHPRNAFALLVICSSCALFSYVSRGGNTRGARFLTLALVLSDLSAFDLTARNKIEVAKTGTNHLDQLMSCRGAADFLKAQPGLFRVQVVDNTPPPIGDVFRIQTTWGGGGTTTAHYLDLINNGPKAADVLNVRYWIKPVTASEPGAIYQDSAWKIYQNLQAYPRAWLVHETAIAPTRQMLLNRAASAETDLHRVALVSESVDTPLVSAANTELEDVKFQSYDANAFNLTAHAAGRAMLVLSEMYYPGWHASVNGHPARIYEVDGGLRGIIVERGESRISMWYLPSSVVAGAALTISAFLITLAMACLLLSSSRRDSAPHPAQP